VRQEDERGLLLLDERRQREHEPVGCVFTKGLVFDGNHPLARGRRELARHGVEGVAGDRNLQRPARLLCRGDRFPRRAIQGAAALLGDDQHAHWITLASSRKLHDQLPRDVGRRAGQQLGLLSPFPAGRARRSAASAGRPGAAALRISFFFAAMMPLSVRVAELVDAARNRQQRGQRQAHPLKPAAFELPLGPRSPPPHRPARP
jgi:hypothetical protein